MRFSSKIPSKELFHIDIAENREPAEGIGRLSVEYLFSLLYSRFALHFS